MPALPRLPNSEPIKPRIAIPFIALTLALVAPAVPQVFSPTDHEQLRDTVSQLVSQVREARSLIDNRDRVTRLYFASELGDLGDSAQTALDELRERPFDPAVADLRSRTIDALDRFSTAAADASLAFDDPARLSAIRPRLDAIASDIATLPGGS